MIYIKFLAILTLIILPSFAKEINLAKINCNQIPQVVSVVDQNSIDATNFLSTIKPKIKKQKREMKALALKNKISKKTIKLIDDLEFLPAVAKLERNQPERVFTFHEYFTKTMPNYKIEDAKKFLKENWEELNKVEQEYKVEKEVIVALILAETYLGKILGKFNIMDALFSLSVTGKRTQFWTNELLNVLYLIDKQNTLYSRDTKGSWAGAVGMIQFMPSSFIKFAVDGTGDGKIDIIKNKLDAFASAANYLHKSGWKYNSPYLREVKLNLEPQDLCTKVGYDFEDGVLVLPDKKLDTEAFIVGDNFAVILQWNRSLFFSTTVGIVFNKLKNESKKP